MGKIKKISEKESASSAQRIDIYPVTSTKAVYDTDNKVLDNYIQHLKKTSTFAGIATPSTNPGTPDQNVFYLAGDGTYANFSNLSVDRGELAALEWNGTWSKQTIKVDLSPNEYSFIEQNKDGELVKAKFSSSSPIITQADFSRTRVHYYKCTNGRLYSFIINCKQRNFISYVGFTQEVPAIGVSVDVKFEFKSTNDNLIGKGTVESEIDGYIVILTDVDYVSSIILNEMRAKTDILEEKVLNIENKVPIYDRNNILLDGGEYFPVDVEDVTKLISPSSNSAYLNDKGRVMTSASNDYHIYKVYLNIGDTLKVNANLYQSICKTDNTLSRFRAVVSSNQNVTADFSYTTDENTFLLISTKGTYNSLLVNYLSIEQRIQNLYGVTGLYVDTTSAVSTAGYYAAPNTLQEGEIFNLSITSDSNTLCGIIDCRDCDGLIFTVYGSSGRFYHPIIFLDDENRIIFLPKEKASYSGSNFINVLFNIPKGATKCVVNEYYTTALSYTLNFRVRKLHKPLNPIHNINVKYFGAKGDGITDDTASIQMALSCGAASVYIPKGIYLTSRTIFVPNGMKINGDGLNNSVILAALSPSVSGTNYIAIQYRGTDALYPIFETERNSEGIIFTGIGVDGTGYLSGGGQYVAYSIHNTKNCKLINCGAKNINYDPINRTDVKAHTIWGQSVYIFKAENVIVDGGHYEGGGYENLGTEFAKHVVIRDGYYGDAWRCSVQIHQASKDIVFTGNMVEQNCDKSHSIFMLHGRRGDLEINSVYITNNYFYGRTNGELGRRGGINNVYGNENDIHIVNNTIDVDHYAISDAGEGWGSNEDGTPKDWFIYNNKIHSLAHGILLTRPQSQYYAQNLIIKNNIIDTVNTAIEAKSDLYIVKDNILRNNKTVTLSGNQYEETSNFDNEST